MRLHAISRSKPKRLLESNACGASLVEFSFVIVLLLLIGLGIVDYGLAIVDSQYMSEVATSTAQAASNYNRSLLNGNGANPYSDPTINPCHEMNSVLNSWRNRVFALNTSKYSSLICYDTVNNAVRVRLTRLSSGCSFCYSNITSIIPPITVQVQVPIFGCTVSQTGIGAC